MFVATHLIGFGAGGVNKVEITQTDSGVQATDATTFTFSSKSFGAEASDREIVVLIGAAAVSSSLPVTGVTIGGVSATKDTGTVSGGAGEYIAEIWRAPVPTGTTGDVVVTFTSTALRCGIDILRMTGRGSTFDTGTSIADPAVDTINVASNGAVAGVCIMGGITGYTWTNLTESIDSPIEGSDGFTTAFGAFASAETGRSITCDNDAGSPVQRAMSLVSYTP